MGKVHGLGLTVSASCSQRFFRTRYSVGYAELLPAQTLQLHEASAGSLRAPGNRAEESGRLGEFGEGCEYESSGACVMARES